MPDMPSLTSLTAGDTQVTLIIDAVLGTDVVYARYRTVGGAWAAESETFKRTGDGNIVITGLTNGTGYQFGIYAKAGSVTSDWDIGFQTPSDGSLAATGAVGLAVKYLGDMIADSATFRTLVGAASRAEALNSVHFIRLSSGWSLPHIIIGTVKDFNIPRYEQDLTRNTLVAVLQAAIPDGRSEIEAFNEFVNVSDGLTADLRDQAESQQAGYLDISNFSGTGPQRPDPDDEDTTTSFEGVTVGAFYQDLITIEYNDV